MQIMKKRDIFDFLIGYFTTVLAMILFFAITNVINTSNMNVTSFVIIFFLCALILFVLSFIYFKSPSKPLFLFIFSNISFLIVTSLLYSYLTLTYHSNKFFYPLVDIDTFWFMISLFYFLVPLLEKDTKVQKQIYHWLINFALLLALTFITPKIDWGIFSAISAILVTCISNDGICAIAPLKEQETYNRELTGESKVNIANLKMNLLSFILTLALIKSEESKLPSLARKLWKLFKKKPAWSKPIKSQYIIYFAIAYSVILIFNILLVRFSLKLTKSKLIDSIHPKFNEPPKSGQGKSKP